MLGWIALSIRRGRIQKLAVKDLIKSDVTIFHEGGASNTATPFAGDPSLELDWLDDFSYRVTAIEYSGGGEPIADSDLSRIRDLMYLKRVKLSSAQVGDRTTRRLTIATRLEHLDCGPRKFPTRAPKV